MGRSPSPSRPLFLCMLRRADNLTTCMCRLSWNLGASTSWNPQGLSRHVIGLLYLYLYLYLYSMLPFTLKMEALFSHETSVTTHQTARCNNPQGHNMTGTISAVLSSIKLIFTQKSLLVGLAQLVQWRDYGLDDRRISFGTLAAGTGDFIFYKSSRPAIGSQYSYREPIQL
jgi:hypothetical protein